MTEIKPSTLNVLEQLENGIKLFLIIGWSLIFWAVLGIHLSYHPVLVFGMIAIYNEYLRDYWSILANESAEYGIWPGLLSVLSQEVLWVLSIALGLTLIFWGLRCKLLKSEQSIGEALGEFAWEQCISLIVASLAATAGAILIGTSFIFGVYTQTPISLEIGVVIELVASSLLLWMPLLSIVFWYLDLEPAPKPYRRVAWIGAFCTLPLAILGLWWGSQALTLEVHLASDKKLPPDFRLYSEDTHHNLQVGGDQGPEFSVFDQVAPVGQRVFAADQTGEFFWERTHPDRVHHDSTGKLMSWRSLYFAGTGIIPGTVPAFFQSRPTEVELDWRERRIYLTYNLPIEQVSAESSQSVQSTEAWQNLGQNWQSRSLSGPVNTGWGIQILSQSNTETPPAETVASYTILASSPPRLITVMQNGQRYERSLPFEQSVQSLGWHRQTGASLWINGAPAFYFFDLVPEQVKSLHPTDLALSYTQVDFRVK